MARLSRFPRKLRLKQRLSCFQFTRELHRTREEGKENEAGKEGETTQNTLMKIVSFNATGFILGGPSTTKCYKLHLFLPVQRFNPQVTHARC